MAVKAKITTKPIRLEPKPKRTSIGNSTNSRLRHRKKRRGQGR